MIVHKNIILSILDVNVSKLKFEKLDAGDQFIPKAICFFSVLYVVVNL